MNKSIIVIDKHPISEKDFMSAVDNELILLNDTGNVSRVTDVLNGLEQLNKITGHAKAKLLWGTRQWWQEHRKNENFGEHVESTTSTKKITVDRYVAVWNYIEDFTIPKQLHSLPMRDLVPIASMLEQGYEPTKEQWKEIELADADLGEVINKIKKKKPRKSGMRIYLEKDGSLNVWRNNIKTYVGFLDLEESLTNPDVSKAIERIVRGAQIIRR